MRTAVYGSGGHGKVVADNIISAGEHELVAYLEDDAEKAGRRIGGLQVRSVAPGIRPVARELRLRGIALGVGDNEARRRIATRCRRARLDVVRAIHPSATVAGSAKLGMGVALMAGSVVNPFAEIREGAVVNTAASVDHDCIVGRYVHVFPGARLAGTVEVGEFSYIGMGASIVQNVNIGKRVTVGAGAVVLDDLEDGVTAVGVPARKVKSSRASQGTRDG